MTLQLPNHQAWLSVFAGLNELNTSEIQRVLGVPMLTAGRLHTQAGEYVTNHNLNLAERELRAKTLPMLLVKKETHGVR